MILLNNVDITSYVDIQSIITNDTIDETLASGSFLIPFVTSTQIANGDQPIPRLSEVNIDGLLYVVAEDNVTLLRKGNNKLYKHEVTIIEPTKILQKRVIPNLTVTQPQGDIANYVYSVNRVNTNSFTDGGLLVNNTEITIPLVTQTQSQDTSKIDNLTLKNTNPYNIKINYTIENRQADNGGFLGVPQNDPDLDITFKVFYGSTQIGTTQTEHIEGKPYNLFGLGADIVKYGGFLIEYTPSVANQSISIKTETLGMNTSSVEDTAYIVIFSVTISQTDPSEQINLDSVVDKVLSFHPEFTLANSTRLKINEIKAPEFTFQSYTLYDALKEIANYVSAIVYLGENDFTTIHFYFYDEDKTTDLEFIDIEKVEYLEGFADGFEINASNVIRDDNALYAIIEPQSIGYLSVRSESDSRGEQIIDTNTAIHLQHPIYKPIRVRVRGLEFVMLDDGSPVTMAKTLVWDITDYVVEYERYNTFTSQVGLNDRGTFKNKSNTIYYRQGDNKLYGLGYLGTVPPGYIETQQPNYAIWEAIMNKAIEEYPTRTYSNNYLVNLSTNSIHDIEVRIEHVPYSDVRLTLYRQEGNNIIYYNEQSSLNDMELLGRIGQDNLNRSGNQVVKYKGITGNNSLVLGSKYENQVLVNYTISRTPTINKFQAEFAVGYSNISEYVGIASAYRQYEVPLNTTVNRRDKYTTFLKLVYKNTPLESVVPPKMYLRTLQSLFSNFESIVTGSKPTYVKLDIDGKDLESTIDTYRMGRTIGLAFDLQDNYSAGIKKTNQTLYTGGTPKTIDIKVQEDARYTDDLGRFENITINYFLSTTVPTVLANANAYPNNDLSGTQPFFTHTYTVNKDARERYGFVWELAFLDGNAKIYDGFIKYNRLAAGTIDATALNIRLLNKGYLPDRNLDLTKTVLITGSLSWQTTYYRLQATVTVAGEYEGIIVTLYNEPIFAIQTNDYSNFTGTTSKYLYLEENT